MNPSDYIAMFDSASALLRATASCLHGEPFAGPAAATRAGARLLDPLAAGANHLPLSMRQHIYALSGWKEAIPARKLGKVDAEQISRWVVNQYPRRSYPAVAIGSSNGALTHLFAAMGIPWLPQTFLIPVRRQGTPDDFAASMNWGKEHAAALLEQNPELQLHHMHDPVQDWLMIQYMAYFRVKRRALGKTYAAFLDEVLAGDGTLIVVDCGQRWPTVRVEERHFFQSGAVGGASPDEYVRGSERLRQFLQQCGADIERWNAPEPDAQRPEAEWGFEPSLMQDLVDWAEQGERRLVRLSFDGPQTASAPVADMVQQWYRRSGLSARRLLVSSFIVTNPWWTLQTGSVPFWMLFNEASSADSLERFLDERDPFAEIYLMLMSHGVDSLDVVPKERWLALLDRATQRGCMVGVDLERFPADFGAFVRHYTELPNMIEARETPHDLLSVEAVEEFFSRYARRYGLGWEIRVD